MIQALVNIGGVLLLVALSFNAGWNAAKRHSESEEVNDGR